MPASNATTNPGPAGDRIGAQPVEAQCPAPLRTERGSGAIIDANDELDLGQIDLDPTPAGVTSSTTNEPIAPTLAEPSPRRRLVFAVVSIGLFMASVDQTIVATALTSIQHDLDAPVNWSTWTITIYALGQVIAMPLAGRISDQFGRKRVFLMAVLLFTATSLLCGLAWSIQILVCLRAVQAIGGGALMPSATGIVSDQFGRDRDRALGLFASIFPIGGIVGPILGGLIVSVWSWRGIFLVNVPVGIVLVTLAFFLIPESARRPGAHLDVVGVVCLAACLLSGMLAVTLLGSGADLDGAAFLGPLAVSIVAGFLFLRHARSATDPFIPITLLRGKGFGVMNAINLLYGAAALGFGALVPLYAEQRYGISPLAAGTLLTARAVGMITVAGLAAMILRRTGYRMPMIVGFLTVSLGLTLMVLAPPAGISAYVWLAVAAAVTGLGMGFSVPATNNASMQLAPDRVAAIAGLRGMFRQTGAITAISITGAILARSATPGITQAYVFAAFAIVMVAVLPLVFLVPEHHGNW